MAKYTTTPAYTRIEYIGGAPPPRIAKYVMGNPAGKFENQVRLVVMEEADIRSNALEAARMSANKVLQSHMKESEYCFRILAYPHHVLRVNKMLAFAGADRIQKGMRWAFGRPIGRAARLRNGQVLMTVDVNSDQVEIAKEALKKASKKLGVKSSIIITRIAH